MAAISRGMNPGGAVQEDDGPQSVVAQRQHTARHAIAGVAAWGEPAPRAALLSIAAAGHATLHAGRPRV